MKYRVLDLFCGSGGAAIGIEDAFIEHSLEVEIVGIDYDYSARHNYPYTFLHRDLKKVVDGRNEISLPASFMRSLQPVRKGNWNFIWASPPCQVHSWAAEWMKAKGMIYVDMTGATQRLLERMWKFYNVPSVTENVPQAPIRKDDRLVGDMFNLRIVRMRHFEIRGFKPRLLPIPRRNEKERYYFSIAGHSWGSWKQWQDAMDIHHIIYPKPIKERKHLLAQCVPPAYSKKLTLEMIQQCLLNK